MIFIIRASHTNEFELQNYHNLPNPFRITVVSSRHPLTPVKLPCIKLFSPTDFPRLFLRKQLLNRLAGGEQWLLGLERMLRQYRDSHPQEKIILHTAETYTPYTHQAVKMKKNKLVDQLVCTCWETIPHNNEKFRRLRTWKNEAYAHVDVFHTPTNRAKDALIKEGVNPLKIKVIAYGVDLSRFKPKRGLPLGVSRKPVIITLARRVPEKGLRLFDNLRNNFQGRADFRWISNQPYSAIPSILRQADIFLHLSHPTETWEEQYGMVLIEAMASGLPIIATSSGAVPEVLGKAGILVRPDDSEDLNKRIKVLLENPKKRSELIKKSVARARSHYDSKKVAVRLRSLYNGLA